MRARAQLLPSDVEILAVSKTILADLAQNAEDEKVRVAAARVLVDATRPGGRYAVLMPAPVPLHQHPDLERMPTDQLEAEAAMAERLLLQARMPREPEPTQ
jgi:hypothetical protein